MKLRWTTLLIIIMTFVGLVFVLLSSLNAILPPFFQRQEKAAATANVQRAVAVIENEYQSLDEVKTLLSGTDGMAGYLQTRNPNALSSIFEPGTFRDFNLIFIGILDVDAEQLEIWDPPSPRERLSTADAKIVQDTYLVVTRDTELRKVVHGLLDLSPGAVLISFLKLPAAVSSPNGGLFLFIGRLVDDALQSRISSQVLFPVSFISLGNEQNASRYASIQQELMLDATPVTRIISENEIGGYVLLRDPLGKPEFLFEVLQNRSSYESSQLIINYLIIAVVSSVAIFSLMTYSLIQFQFLGRVLKLSQEVNSIGTSGALDRRVGVTRRDEISNLSLNINDMLSRLESAQKQLEVSFQQVKDGRKRLEDLSRRLVNVQEEERRSIALELHDEIGQNLTGLKLLLEGRKKIPDSNLKKQVEKAQALTNDLIKRVRELSLQLRPSMLDDLGLLPALEWLINQFLTQSKIHVEFTHDSITGIRLPPEIEIAAYRIIQEALTNIARHAGVKKAALDVSLQTNLLEIKVTDKGLGFNLDKTLHDGSTSGISGMRERVTMLGGEMDIISSHKKGTLLKIELPVKGYLERRKRERNHPAG